MFALVFPCVFVLQQAVIHRLILPALARESQQAREQRGNAVAYVKRGDKVPSFRIRDIDGNEFSTGQLRGKVVLLNFFATWCGPCILELPHIQQIWKSHRDNDDFALLVIGREETDTAVRDFRATRELSFPLAADTDRMVYGLFAKELIPRTYLIAKDGTICFESTGYVEDDLVALSKEVTKQLRRKHDTATPTMP
jgi:peroxiredoxin